MTERAGIWRRRVAGVAVVLVACGASFAGGIAAGEYRARQSSEWVEGRLISTAIESVRANALDTLPSDELIKRAVSGMLRELHDPYAAMLRTDGFERYRGSLQGDGRGLGITMRRQGGTISVSRVVRGSPAWAYGVRPGDRILAVDGLMVEAAWGKNDSTSRQSDTTTFMLQRAPSADTMHVAVVKRDWHHPAVRDAGFVADRVGYVHLTSISAKSADELEQSVEALVERGAQSLILDLRGNNGGLLEEGVRIASLFLPRGVRVASVTGRSATETTVHEARRSRWSNLPMTVLVDAHTASAAELIAAALRDHRRALLVGARTYGKGYVQRVVRLSPDVALRLTTARWLSPNGQHVERREGEGKAAKGGLEPDVRVTDASRYDPFTVPSHWGRAMVAHVTREADSIATEALRDQWVTSPTSVLEARVRARAAERAPERGLTDVQRATWVGIATRLSTVRTLESINDEDALLRYQAREDAALRAGLDVVAPGLQSVSVQPADMRRLRASRAAHVAPVTPRDSTSH